MQTTYFQPSQKTALKAKWDKLCNAKMRPGAHGYEEYPGWRIVDAAKGQLKKFRNQRNGAHILMMAVLSANRNFEKAVRKNMECVRCRYPKLTLRELAPLTNKTSLQFKAIWGHDDEKKQTTLKLLVKSFLTMYPDSSLSDYQKMKKWAKAASLSTRKSDSIGTIPNVGVATFQHLRLLLGVNTVKPDVRVQQVLTCEFGLPKNTSKIQAVVAVEQLAGILGVEASLIDQVFVKYGSGHYQKSRAASRSLIAVGTA